MKREHFVKVVEEALDSLPQEFRSRIRNVAVLVEDMLQYKAQPGSVHLFRFHIFGIRYSLISFGYQESPSLS